MSESVKEKILKKIEAEKEILSVMPQNNEKDINEYKNAINSYIKEYKKYEKDINNILEQRYSESVILSENKDLTVIKSRILKLEEVLNLLNEYKTSYEKMGLDKIIYKMSKYYKENLDMINIQILECIKKFAEVGIILKISDFNYSSFVNEYMTVFFEEIRVGELNSEELGIKFEELYWKCPELITHIQLNLRSIYLNKQTQIDAFYKIKKNEILKEWKKTPQEIFDTYIELKNKENDLISNDKNLIINDFLTGKLLVKEYSLDKIQKLTQNLISEEDFDEKDVIKFLNTLTEYKNYMEFEFFIEDVKKYYLQKDNYKKKYDETLKKILSNEKKLEKISKKISGKGLFWKKHDETNQIVEQNKIILEIKGLYKELELNKFYSKVISTLNDNSTIFDVLSLVSSYYMYAFKCVKDNNTQFSQEEIDQKIEDLSKFLNMPGNSFINAITFLDEKDMPMIIKDKYRLLNFNVELEDLNNENIDTIINSIDRIRRSFCINKNDLKIEDIEVLIELDKLLNK